MKMVGADSNTDNTQKGHGKQFQTHKLYPITVPSLCLPNRPIPACPILYGLCKPEKEAVLGDSGMAWAEFDVIRRGHRLNSKLIEISISR